MEPQASEVPLSVCKGRMRRIGASGCDASPSAIKIDAGCFEVSIWGIQRGQNPLNRQVLLKHLPLVFIPGTLHEFHAAAVRYREFKAVFFQLSEVLDCRSALSIEHIERSRGVDCNQSASFTKCLVVVARPKTDPSLQVGQFFSLSRHDQTRESFMDDCSFGLEACQNHRLSYQIVIQHDVGSHADIIHQLRVSQKGRKGLKGHRGQRGQIVLGGSLRLPKAFLRASWPFRPFRPFGPLRPFATPSTDV